MKGLLIVIAALAAASANAQHHQPHAEQQGRQIKALSADEVKQYLGGAGMGYAKTAELNHYPGPTHVLELGERLNLSPQQRAQTRQLMDAHKAEARVIGANLVDAESRLETLFRRGKLEEAELARAVQETARLQGEYRLSHLETHRRMRALLSDEQVKRYDELRGYGAGPSQHQQRKH